MSQLKLHMVRGVSLFVLDLVPYRILAASCWKQARIQQLLPALSNWQRENLSVQVEATCIFMVVNLCHHAQLGVQ